MCAQYGSSPRIGPSNRALRLLAQTGVEVRTGIIWAHATYLCVHIVVKMICMGWHESAFPHVIKRLVDEYAACV